MILAAGASLLLGMNSSFAYDSFPFTKVSSTFRDGVYKLTSSKVTSYDVTVDCASFLFGITYNYSKTDKPFLYLYEAECYDLLDTLVLWDENNQPGCLKVDFENKDWNLQKGIDGCE